MRNCAAELRVRTVVASTFNYDKEHPTECHRLPLVPTGD